MPARKIILDTDIGDDIDDAYALALILASPEIELLGVSTVFRNTPARARQALTLLKIAGREETPVAAGCAAVLSPRTPQAPDSAEKLLHDAPPPQDAASLSADLLPDLAPIHGVDFLIETIMAGAGDIVALTIGPMTNLAMALIKEPRLAAKIPRIVAMAGVYLTPGAEWNVRCDPVAAALVLQSGIPMTLTGLDVTRQCRFQQAQLERLYACDRPLARYLAQATRLWKKSRLPLLHDPLAVQTLLAPELVETRNGRARVDLSNAQTYAHTAFEPADAGRQGPHDMCVKVKGPEAVEFWLERVLAF